MFIKAERTNLIMRVYTITFLLFISFITKAQNIPIGGWEDHLSYKSAISVAEGAGKVFCATQSGFFIYKKSDNSMERLSKVNGLSDVEVNNVNFNPYNNKAILIYKNSNLDIIDNSGAITNIPDIKRKNIVGNKSINNVYFINQYAYLACGFGIVVLDMDRNEIKDTYYIGLNGAYVNVKDITSDGTNFYAATTTTIYKAPMNAANLADFTNWSIMTGLPTGVFNAITSINGNVIVNYSKQQTSNTGYADTLYKYNGIAWSYFGTPGGYIVNSIKNTNNNLVVTFEGAVSTFDQNLNGNGYYSGYFSDITRAKSAVKDAQNNLWIADTKYGLVSFTSSGYSYRYPNGPASGNLNGMALREGNLIVAPGSNLSGNSYIRDGIYVYSNNTWSNIRGDYPGIVNLDTVYDLVNVMIDKNNSNHFFASSWGLGAVEFLNGAPVSIYNESNSSLQGLGFPNFDPIWVQGMAQDENNNFWFTNNQAHDILSVKKTNGQWQSHDFSSVLGASVVISNIIVDKNDQKWAILPFPSNGIMVYKGGASSIPSSSNTKKLSTLSGNGGLPSSSVFCLKEDLDGEIWVGTDKGIAVFYSPENVFSTQNFDAQQILIEQDGYVQILLETESIQDIAVDAANRKWIATANSGVFLVSADGTQQIYHFDESNSPLYSNNVRKIVINDATGEVYFGTSKGILSFRGTATESFETFTDVYAFPNPVRPGYDGPIAIKGLVNNSTIKITDISGTLVYEMKSEGGQALWYGKNFEGTKVSSGVYMVFGTNDDGSQKMVTKILLVN